MINENEKPSLEIARMIYDEALEQANKLDVISLPRSATVYTKELHPYMAGSHRIRSRFGGYGSYCYKRFFYGEFEFCITLHSDYHHPFLEVSYKPDRLQKSCITIKLTKELWDNTDLLTELGKAYQTISLDFEAAVKNESYSELFQQIGDSEHKYWLIEHIKSVHERLFDSSGIVQENLKMQEKLKDEYKGLKATHKEKLAALENHIRESFLPDQMQHK